MNSPIVYILDTVDDRPTRPAPVRLCEQVECGAVVAHVCRDVELYDEYMRAALRKHNQSILPTKVAQIFRDDMHWCALRLACVLIATDL